MPDSIQTLQSQVETRQLMPALGAAADAGRAAHRAAGALTDTLSACQHLPADIYRYAPDVFAAAQALTAAGRALTACVQQATTARTPEHLHAVDQAVNVLRHATAAVDVAAEALRSAAAWYTAALPAAGPR